MIKRFIIVILLLLCSTLAYSACQEYTAGNWYPGSYAAQSLTQADVASCFADGNFADHDIIHLKAGEVTWTSGVSYSHKASVIGAGKATTIINYQGSGTCFNINYHNESVLSNLKINIPSSYNPNEMVYVRADDFIIHDINFYNDNATSEYGVLATGINGYYEPTGLVYNCDFRNARILVYGSQSFDVDSGTTAHVQWADTNIALASDRQVVVENCTFTRTVSGNSIDSSRGGSYTFRFNTITNSSVEIHSSLGSFPAGGNHYRAGKIWEIYGNSFDDAGGSIYTPFRLRGGTGVVFRNTVTDTYSDNRIIIDNVRSTEGNCNGSNPADGNEDGYGYPCRDQIGQGSDSSLWTTANPNPAQADQPAYLWNNTYGVAAYNAAASNVIHADRDYYDKASGIQVSSSSPFDGTTGTGWGTLANRPATCTTGVGYFATDQGSWCTGCDDGLLYQCTSTDTWGLLYTPLAYPHPSRGADATPPVMSSPLPQGSQICTSDPRNVTLQVTTDEWATCKYDTADDTYDNLSNTFTTTGDTSHSQTVSLACDTAYVYYFRCKDASDNKNSSSDTATFNIEAEPPPPVTTTASETGSGGQGSHN